MTISSIPKRLSVLARFKFDFKPGKHKMAVARNTDIISKDNCKMYGQLDIIIQHKPEILLLSIKRRMRFGQVTSNCLLY